MFCALLLAWVSFMCLYWLFYYLSRCWIFLYVSLESWNRSVFFSCCSVVFFTQWATECFIEYVVWFAFA